MFKDEIRYKKQRNLELQYTIIGILNKTHIGLSIILPIIGIVIFIMLHVHHFSTISLIQLNIIGICSILPGIKLLLSLIIDELF